MDSLPKSHPCPAQGERLSTHRLSRHAAAASCSQLQPHAPPSPASLQDAAEGDKSAGTKPDEPKLEGAALLEAIKKQVPIHEKLRSSSSGFVSSVQHVLWRAPVCVCASHRSPTAM